MTAAVRVATRTPRPAAPAVRPVNAAAVRRLARACRAKPGHARQVTRLALALFDALEVRHARGAPERALLEAAARLHDIGWIAGRAGHHKTARRLVLAAPGLAADARCRRLLGELVRYHRRALPSLRHRRFRALVPADRRRVRLLAGLLRLADALDVSHRTVVRELACRLAPGRLTLVCRVAAAADAERAAARAKADLLTRVLRRKVVLVCRPA